MRKLYGGVDCTAYFDIAAYMKTCYSIDRTGIKRKRVIMANDKDKIWDTIFKTLFLVGSLISSSFSGNTSIVSAID